MINRIRCEIARQRVLMEQHHASLVESETRTRTILIDPLLRTLGWNVADPSQVTLEYPAKAKKVDYALLSEDGAPIAGLEAKKLHEPLPKHYPQLIDSAVSLKSGRQTEYFLLTNGNVWQLYRGISDKFDNLDTKQIFEVVIATTSIGECAFMLAQLWRPDYTVVPPVPAESVRFWPMVSVPVTKGWNRLSCWSPNGKPKGTLRFPTGKEFDVVFWNQLIPYVGEWLYSCGRLSDQQLPVPSEDKKRYILSDTAKHPNGQKFKNPARLKCGWKYDKVHPTAGGHLRDAIHLLRYCRVDPGDVLVRIDSADNQ